MSPYRRLLEAPDERLARFDGRGPNPRGIAHQFDISLHAMTRMDERSVPRQVVVAALSRPPLRHLARGLAIFRSHGFEMLVDLNTRIVITVLPKNRQFADNAGRDAGCSAHRGRRRSARPAI